MRYSDLTNLLTRFLPGSEITSDIDVDELLDSEYVRNTILRIVGTHQADEALNQEALDSLEKLLATRFNYLCLCQGRALYTENTKSATNRFCIALATELQAATGKNRFKLLMPTIKFTKLPNRLDLDNPDVAVTDFILSTKKQYIIDVAQCLERAAADAQLCHTHYLNDDKSELLLSDATVKRLLAHSPEVSKFYDIIKYRHEYMSNGDTLGRLLLKVVTALEKRDDCTPDEKEDAEAAANVAINDFKNLCATLSEQNKKNIDNLSVDNTITLSKALDESSAANLRLILNKYPRTLCINVSEGYVIDYLDSYDKRIVEAQRDLTLKLGRLRKGVECLPGEAKFYGNAAFRDKLFKLLTVDELTILSAKLHVPIKNIVASPSHTMVLTDENKLYECGNDEYGREFGLPFKKASKIPDKIALIAGGISHYMVVTDTNRLFAHGSGYNGELGCVDKGPYRSSSEFIEIKDLPGKIQQVALGAMHTMVLLDSGKLYGCGWNSNGRLGLANKAERVQQLTEVTSIPDEVASVGAAYNGNLALTVSGKLYVCGNNDSGQLGLGDNVGRNQFTEVPGIPGKIIQMAAGHSHTLVLTDAGKVYVSGNNSSGQLGLGDKKDRNVFTEVPISGKVTQITAGQSHSLVLIDANKVYGCGLNENGQLGVDDVVNRDRFTEAKGLSGKVTQISAAWSHSLALTDTGELHGCGSNYMCQLGWPDKYLQIKKFTKLGVHQPYLVQLLNAKLAPRSPESTATIFAPKPSVGGSSSSTENKLDPKTLAM